MDLEFQVSDVPSEQCVSPSTNHSKSFLNSVEQVALKCLESSDYSKHLNTTVTSVVKA